MEPIEKKQNKKLTGKEGEKTVVENKKAGTMEDTLKIDGDGKKKRKSKKVSSKAESKKFERERLKKGKVSNKPTGENIASIEPVNAIVSTTEEENKIKENKRKKEEKLKNETIELNALSKIDIYRWQTLDYKLAKRLAMKDLSAFEHGAIKTLCNVHKLTYHTVIGLINDSITFEAPKLVLDLLHVLDYEVKLNMEIVATSTPRQYIETFSYTLRKKGI